MSRNYHLGSRNMSDAARIALTRAVYKKEMSFATASAVTERFTHFVSYLKEHGIGRMEGIHKQVVLDYGAIINKRVRRDACSVPYAHNLISAINTVMRHATNNAWQTVSPTQDCLFPNRCAIRKIPTIAPNIALEAIDFMRGRKMHREASISELAFHFGLRSKEASLLDSRTALKESQKTNIISIIDGTKGGRKRQLKVTNDNQRKALIKAAIVQGKGRSLIPKNLNWAQWKESGLRDGRNILKSYNIKGYRELRSCYAAERYQQLTGFTCTANGGIILNKTVDKNSRLIIANELGHGRIDVVSSYIGGRK